MSLCLLPAAAHPGRLPVKIYTTADGLARDNVSRIYQDSRGFLWFATSEGLSRFDGFNFVNYGTNEGLPHRVVNDILEARDGTYWVATEGGLSRLDPEVTVRSRAEAAGQTGGGGKRASLFVTYLPSAPETAKEVNVLFQDRAGNIWCGTRGGLFRLERGANEWKLQFVDIGAPSAGLSDADVEAIIEDRRGALWLGSRSGLYRRDPAGVVTRFTTDHGLPINNVLSLLEDREGRIWVGTTTRLCRLVTDPDARGTSVVARSYAQGGEMPEEWIRAIFQGSDGSLWIVGNGLSRSAGEGEAGEPLFRRVGVSEALNDRRLSSIAEDRDGNIWIGTQFDGVMKIARAGFTTYGPDEGLPDPSVNAIFEDRAGELVVLTPSPQTPISIFDGRRFSSVGVSFREGVTQGWGWNQVTFQDSEGDWWVPSNHGVYRYPRAPGGNFPARRPKNVYTPKEGLGGQDVFRLYEDSRGDIWIGTVSNDRNSLSRWERATGTIHNYGYVNGFPPSGPTAFREGRQGDLWIGFYLGGVARYHEGNFKLFTTDDGLPPGFIRDLYFDAAGRLWVGTSDGGLARVDDPQAERPHFQRLTTADGLSSNQVTCFTEDRWGRLYIGTGRGLDRLDPATNRIRHFTAADGLAGNFVNAAYRDREGVLWFGTLRGLSRLVPEPERRGDAPPVYIGGLRLASGSYALSELGASEVGGIDLGHEQNQVQVDFFGLGFAPGEVLRYQHKLEGADDDWSAPDEQRSVNYANLQPGDYRFMVRAVNADGRASERPAVVSFSISPPFWRRGWFLALALLVTGSTVFAVDRYRVARMKELDAALTRSEGLTQELTAQRAELRRANRTLELENAVTRVLDEAASPREASARVLQVICEEAGWDFGALWDVEPQRGVLRCVDVWQRPGMDAPGFESETRGHTFPPGVGLPGRVFSRGEAIWVARIGEDSNFPREAAAARNGLRSAFGFPLLLGREVIGVLEFFSREARDRDEEFTKMLPPIGAQIGQLIERKRAAEALAVSETRFRTIVEQSPLSTMIFSADGRLLSVNRAYEEYWGITFEQIAGWDIFADEQLIAAGIVDLLRRGFAGEFVAIPAAPYDPLRSTKAEFFDPSTPVRWIQSFVYPVKDEEGRVREVVYVLEDVTERKQAEQTLRESETRFRTLAETASDAIITIDESSTIIFVNAAAEKVFGYPAEGLTGADLTMLMPEYLRHLHRAGVERYTRTGRKHISWEAVELPGLHRSGREIPLELSFGEFTKDGRRYFTGIARDVTERKRAEEELRRSREERLAELERVRKRIASDLHDDIGSSLTQISLLSEVLRQRLNGGDAESPVSRPLALIASSSRELVDSMSDIVWAINPQKDHLSDLTQRMRTLASDVFPARGIEFKFRAPGADHDIPLGANLRREIFLIYKESVNNVVKHSGAVRAEVEFGVTDDVLTLRVWDDGRGFDLSREGQGHGLVSMRARAREMGGSLEFESGAGRGTAVTLRVPLAEQRGRDAAPS